MTDFNQPPSAPQSPSTPPQQFANATPHVSGHGSGPAKKRGLGPLAIVLLLSGGFFTLFLVVSGLFLFSGDSSSKPKGPTLFTKGSVGVVEVKGVILDSKQVLRKLEDFDENSQIKAVVLRLNSPGGAVAPSQEIYEAVKAFKKPLVVSMGSVAASGAYYIACGAKKVFANAGTITGSIGVIMEFANLEKLFEWMKISRYSIKTGKFKDAGSPNREMTAEERELLQGMVDDVLLQFKQAVADGRKLRMEEVDLIADGRIFSGSQAKKAKMVDELGTLQDAVNEAGRQGGIKGKPDVVYSEKKRRSGLLEFLLESDRSGEDRADGISNASLMALALRVLRGADLSSESVLDSEFASPTPGVYWLWNAAR